MKKILIIASAILVLFGGTFLYTYVANIQTQSGTNKVELNYTYKLDGFEITFPKEYLSGQDISNGPGTNKKYINHLLVMLNQATLQMFGIREIGKLDDQETLDVKIKKELQETFIQKGIKAEIKSITEKTAKIEISFPNLFSGNVSQVETYVFLTPANKIYSVDFGAAPNDFETTWGAKTNEIIKTAKVY